MTKETEDQSPNNTVIHNNLTAMSLLLKAGASLELTAENGITVLILAAQDGHTEAVNLLLTNHAKVDTNNYQALHLAATYGHTKVVNLLLNHGSTVTNPINTSYALELAATYGHTKVVNLLLNHGSTVTNPINTSNALDFAAQHGHTEVVTLLLSHGSTVTNPINTSNALMLAVQHGHTKVVELLVINNTYINDIGTDTGYTALMLAAELAAENGHTKIVQILLDNGADIHATSTNNGHTALMLAAQNGHTELVQILLNNGSDIHAVSSKGYNALMVAAIQGKAKVVEILLKNDANIHAVANGNYTALMLAAMHGKAVVVELLLANKANVNAVGYCGWNALMHATAEGLTEIVQLLLEHGANPSYNDDGHSALTLAKQKALTGDRAAIEILKMIESAIAKQNLAEEAETNQTAEHYPAIIDTKAADTNTPNIVESNEADILSRADYSNQQTSLEAAKDDTVDLETSEEVEDTTPYSTENYTIFEQALLEVALSVGGEEGLTQMQNLLSSTPELLESVSDNDSHQELENMVKGWLNINDAPSTRTSLSSADYSNQQTSLEAAKDDTPSTSTSLNSSNDDTLKLVLEEAMVLGVESRLQELLKQDPDTLDSLLQGNNTPENVRLVLQELFTVDKTEINNEVVDALSESRDEEDMQAMGQVATMTE